jgi:hypothetical protein
MNLAFLDEVAPTPREALQDLSAAESERTLRGAEEFLERGLRIRADGVELTGVVEHAEMAAEPDAALAALFPRTGRRALIRASVLVVYATQKAAGEVEFTWSGYPRDVMGDGGLNAGGVGGAENDGAAARAPMVLEAQIQTDEGVSIVRFSEPEPVVRWSRDADAAAHRLVDVPGVPGVGGLGGGLGGPGRTLPGLSIGLVGLALAWVTAAGAMGVLRRAAVPTVAACVALLIGAVAVRDRMAVAAPGWVPAWATHRGAGGVGGVGVLMTEAERVAVFDALHTNLYRAFSSPDAGVVYDALAATLDGPLIDPMYNAIFRSLVDAEQGGELGVVTAVRAVTTTIEPLPEESGGRLEMGDLAFRAVRTWRVDGTVYHWGHSHTRTFEYEAAFDVAPTPAGWRVVGHELRAQRRVGADGDAPRPAVVLPPGTEL